MSNHHYFFCQFQVPIRLDVHWILVSINLKEETIFAYDSLNYDTTDVLDTMKKYINDEHIDKKGSEFDFSDFQYGNANAPKQENQSDCGMFVCKYCDFISRNEALTFTQDDMQYYRIRMIYEIINYELLAS